MLASAQIVTLLLVALAMATAMAHALELPGKMRLPRDTYLAVQSIYSESRDWTALRDQWEYSHLTRAILSFIAVALLAAAISVT